MTDFFTLAAQAVILLHLAWIVFVVTGAFWLRRHPRWRLAHLLAVCYSVAIEIFRWTCPLTRLEQALWKQAGRAAYQEAFLTHYLEGLIYAPVPQWILVGLALAVLGVTLALYTTQPAHRRRDRARVKQARRARGWSADGARE